MLVSKKVSEYTAYIKLSYSTEDPTAKTEVISVDIPESLLPFLSALHNAMCGNSYWDIEGLLILSSDSIASIAPDEHLNSVGEFIKKVGGIKFIHETNKKQ